MDLYLKQKTAVVTGASQGIGRAITKELAREGVQVFATARNEELLNLLSDEVAREGGVKPITYVQDLLQADAPKNLAAAALISAGVTALIFLI